MKRAPTNCASEPEKAQAIEPIMKTSMARRNTRRAPNRSAIQLEIGMKMARATR